MRIQKAALLRGIAGSQPFDPKRYKELNIVQKRSRPLMV